MKTIQAKEEIEKDDKEPSHKLLVTASALYKEYLKAAKEN